MPKLRALHYDRLGLADWQYAECKDRYCDSIQLIAPGVETGMLHKHNKLASWNYDPSQTEREILFLAYRKLLATPPAWCLQNVLDSL